MQLLPVTSKRAPGNAYQLLDKFSIFSVPSILQSDNGREFVNSVIEQLCLMWQDLRVVHGKSRYWQNQGSVKKSNIDIKIKLKAWLRSNEATHWVDGHHFIPMKKSKVYHEGLKYPCYGIMFEQPIKFG